MNFIINKDDYLDVKMDAISRLIELKESNEEFGDIVELFSEDRFFGKFFAAMILALVNQHFLNGAYFSVRDIVEDVVDSLKLSEKALRQMDWVTNEMQVSVANLINAGNMFQRGSLYRVDICRVDYDFKGIICRVILPMETAINHSDCIDITKLVEDIRIGV